MNWAKIIWWVVTNAPELWQLIKRIIELLEEAGNSQKSKSIGNATASLKARGSTKPAKVHATIRADLR